MFYATRDFDGETITEDADILAFTTLEEVKDFLGTETIEVGRFSDCWIKVITEPDEDTDYTVPFKFDDLIIQRPGQHPGGFRFWITPRPDVWVPFG